MEKILIVDDSRLIRMRLKKMIGDSYELIEAENGKDALLKAVSENPDCIISDLLMPEMDGFQLLEQIQKKELGFPVIVLTADIQSDTRKRCLELNAITVLNKPPKQEELDEALASVEEKLSGV
jgi:CheY-like chemotaxis protein